MLTKTPKPLFTKWVRQVATVGFIIEGGLFVGAYFFWNKTNTDREYRRYLYENHPTLLDIYYKTGELFGSDKIRETDIAHWKATLPNSE